jgi:acetolactate synthase-1/3 small subunit
MRHTLSVLVENKFGVLARVAGLFSGRGFNIDTLNVAPTENPSISRITATVRGDDAQLDQCVKQLDKLIEVLEIKDFKRGEYVARELLIVKIAADSKSRAEIIQICDVFRAKIVDVSASSVIVEMTGNDGKIKAFTALIEAFGVLELARTGNLALEREGEANE